jgi:hypothetical protein
MHGCAGASPLSMNQSTHHVGINTISIELGTSFAGAAQHALRRDPDLYH